MGVVVLIGIDASRTVVAQRTGTERYSLEITRALIDVALDDRFVLYFNQPPTTGLLPRDERVRWRVMPAPRLWTHGRLSVEMLARPPDVLFVPAHTLPLYHPRASVTTVHDLGYLHFPDEHTRMSRLARHLANRWSAARAAHTVAISGATRDDLLRHYRLPASRITVVHHGNSDGFRPERDPTRLAELRGRHGLNAPYFLFVGTLQPRKNYERLLAAFDQFAVGATERYLLAFAGARGWQVERFRRALDQMRVRDRVRLLGYADDADLPGLMSGAVALTFPSLYEGFGLPALEAMACGTPVLTSGSSSLPEVVGDAALLVDPLDIEAIADGLARLANDEALRAELRERGLARAATFTWQRAARETLEVLRAVGRADTA